ncbi:APR protein, partial [Piaya cayana]|nr:APR protein [Piaya cayana]
ASRMRTDYECLRAPTEREVAAECALQLRRIGDKWDLRQKILNLLTKLFCPQT